MGITGRIIAQHKSVWIADAGGTTFEAALRGALKQHRHNKPCVGDQVTLEPQQDAPGRAIITELLPRRNRLHRPAIANVDQVLFLVSLREPSVDRDAMDRFLVLAESQGLHTAIVFNKVDLLDETGQNELAEREAVYGAAGYACVRLSALSGAGREGVLELCRGKVSTLAGISGVGKSTLLNALQPGLDLRTAQISERIERGVHTTTSSTLLRLAPETFVADTPGFTSLELPTIDDRDLHLYFPELRALVGQCRFNNCVHIDEPGCVVREARLQDAIAPSRYDHYRAFYAAIAARPRHTPARARQ